MGRGGRRGRRGSGRKRGAPSGYRGSSSSSPGRRRRPTSGRPWGRGPTGTTVMTGMMRGTSVDERGDKGEGGDKGSEAGGDKGGEKEGDTGGDKGGAGSKDEPRQPLTTQEE